MKKLYVTKIFFLIGFFLAVSVIRSFYSSGNWFTSDFVLFWAGGFLGLVLADIDHIIYVYYLKPQDVTSKEVGSMMVKKKYRASMELLAKTRRERTGHIFHTAVFQLILLGFAVFVITSSGSLFGRGMVLGMVLGLLVDQASDLVETGTINAWFKDFPAVLDAKKQRWFVAGDLIALLFLSFYF